MHKIVRSVFCAIILISAASRSLAAVESPVHRELFKAYYRDFVQRHPEAFVRHRVAVVAPDQLATLRSFESTQAALEQVFRVLPQPSISFSVEGVGFSFDVNNLAALRDLVARTPLGGGLAPPEITEARYRQFIDEHPLDVAATADAIYDLVRDGSQRITNANFTPQQVALLRAEFDANLALDPKLKSPTATFEALLRDAPESFDRMARAADATLTQDQLKELRTNADAFRQFVADKFNHIPTDAELRELFDGVAGELKDVGTFVQQQRDMQKRVKTSQDMHAAVDILSTLLGFVEPRAAAKFATIAHQTIVAGEQLAAMAAGAVTLGGVGAVVVAAAAIINAFDNSPSEQEQLQSFILEIYRDIMHELEDIKRGIFEIRVAIAALDERITEVLLDNRIGFSGIELALQSTTATLRGLALESDRFYEVVAMDPAQQAHSAVVDLMTNPANAPLRDALQNNPAGTETAFAQQNLSRMAQLGLEDSKEAPFSNPSVPFDGNNVLTTPRSAAVENRVGDLPALGALLAVRGATVHGSRLQSIAHPVALAQSIAWYTDARDRLPRPVAVDANFGLLCGEVRRVAGAAAESRHLTPAALRFLAGAATQFVQTATPLIESTKADAAFLRGTIAPPLPDEAGQRLDLAIAAKFATQSFVILQAAPVVQRAATASDLAQLPSGTQAGVQIAALDGCVTVEQVVFDGTPSVTTDGFGIRSFSGAPRFALRSRRRICSAEHPILSFPSSKFAEVVEQTMAAIGATLPEEPRSDAETAANAAGLQRIGELLTRKRGEELAKRAIDDGLIRMQPPRRVNHITSFSEPEIGRTHPIFVRHFMGFFEWRTEATWEQGVPGHTAGDRAWTFEVRRAALDDFISTQQIDEFAEKVRDQKLGVLAPSPIDALAADLRQLEAAFFTVQNDRARQAFATWTDTVRNSAHPAAQALANVRLARYAVETFARFGFGECGEAGEELRDALRLATCGDSPACDGDAPDVRAKQPLDFLEVRDAADAIAKMAALGSVADRLDALMQATPTLCRDAGPFGVREAAEILNGVARRSEVFLPAGCMPDGQTPE
jgi:hypothetical protein